DRDHAAFDASSAGAEQHDGNVAFGPGLVLVVVGPLRRHGRPHTLLVFGRPGARPDGEDLVPHLDLHVGVCDQVLVPSGVLRPGLPIGIPPSESIRLSRAVSSSVPALSARRAMRPWAAVVSMKPGAIVFTRTPLGPTCFDSHLL